MKRSLLRLWLGTSVLASALAVGCSHGLRHCATCGRADAVPVGAATPILNPESPAQSPYASLPTPPPPPEGVRVVHTVAKPAPAGGGWQVLDGTVREEGVHRRTYTDLTANPAFAHAPDYSWLVGELQSAGPDAGWCVRFASVEEDRDVAALVEVPPSDGLKAGQLVRVEGQFVDPHSREVRPAYKVTAIRPVRQ